jgi:hypothetical protein
VSNPIQYTSRSYQTIMADINSDPELADKPEWWKRIWAGIGDVLSVWNNAAANNAYLRTAFSRRAVADLCQLIDYQLAPAFSSEGIILFDLKDDASLPSDVSRENIAAQIPGTVAISERRFEAYSGATVSAKTLETTNTDWDTGTDVITVPSRLYTGEKVTLTTNGTFPAPIILGEYYYVIEVTETTIRLAETRSAAFSGQYIDITTAGTGNHSIRCRSRPYLCRQQTTQPAVIIGTSDGTSRWQEYQLSESNVIRDSIDVTVNEATWTRVDTFAFSTGSDRHFRVSYTHDGMAIVEFGDGEYGRIPEAGPIECGYATGGGAASNVTTGNRVKQYAGAAAIFESTSNPGPLTGGSEPEGIESAKRLAPLLLKARDRFVTAEDGEALAIGYGGLSQVRVIPNAFGVLTARVVAVANGGGNPGESLQTAIEEYLKERSVLGSINVTFNDLTLTPVDVTSAAAVQPGQLWAAVEPMFQLGWRLALSEAGAEIYSVWQESGVTAAVGVINTIFSSSYTADDVGWIGPLLEQYDRFPPRSIGGSLHESEVTAFIKGGIPLIKYMTISAPAFPLEQDADEILTVGTLTLTEAV